MLNYSLTHSHTLSLPLSCFISLTLTLALSPSLTASLLHSPSHSFTQSLPHSLTFSLTSALTVYAGKRRPGPEGGVEVAAVRSKGGGEAQDEDMKRYAVPAQVSHSSKNQARTHYAV